jgi:hypothetical protein
MGWTFNTTKQSLPVVKQDGLCHIRSKQKYCPYWVAKQSKRFGDNKKILGYKCTLFNEDKVGYPSVPDCNAKYGKNYDGPVIV